MMSFEEFTAWVSSNIRREMPAEYLDAEVKTADFRKLGNCYKGLYLSMPGVRSSPAVDLELCYREYAKGFDKDLLLGQIALALQIQNRYFDPDSLLEYEDVRDKLFIRVSNAEKNRELLKLVPHIRALDLAVSCHVFADDGRGGFGSTMVTNEMLASYGVSQEQLFEDAAASGTLLFPAELSRIGDILSETDSARDDGCRLLVLTNRRRTLGASALFYPGIMEMISGHIGGGYYVLPSSVHEVLILPDEGLCDAADLRDLVTAVNSSVLDPGEFLSDNVYYYDAKKRNLDIC